MNEESKPGYSFEENNDKAVFVLVIDELKVSRKITKKFKKKPSNATYNKSIGSQSFNLVIKINDTQKTYRFQVNRLPTPINVEDTKTEFDDGKVVITFVKSENESWKPFAEYDFETDHLVKK